MMLSVCSDEPIKGLDRLRDDLADIQQRWIDRFPFEGRSYAKGYFSGRLWLTFEFNWRLTGRQYKCFFCVIANGYVDPTFVLKGGDSIDSTDCGDYNIWDEKAVLIVHVKGLKSSPVKVEGAVFGPYFVEDKFFGAGQGGLHLRQGGIGREILPLFRERKVGFGSGFLSANYTSCQVIKCSAEVMDCISDAERQNLRDWFCWDIGKLIPAWFEFGNIRIRCVRKSIELRVKRFRQPLEFVDVFLGPFGFEPRAN